MAASAVTEELRRKAPVVAAVDLREVPAGTRGKVVIVNGLKWIRYWVRFDNGVSIGSLDRSKIATLDEWQRRLDGTDGVASADATADAAGDDDASATDGAAGGAGVTTSTGVVVPQKLIDRSAAARARLGG